MNWQPRESEKKKLEIVLIAQRLPVLYWRGMKVQHLFEENHFKRTKKYYEADR